MAKKKYKGKYPGPDKFKGDKKKIAAWKAAKRKVAAKPAASKPAAPKPAAPKTPTGPQSAYPSSNVSANSSGNIQLQTNAEIESALLDAREAQWQAEQEATQMQQQGVIQDALSKEALRVNANQSRGDVNARNAYQGLRGTSALNRKYENESNLSQQNNAIAEQLRQTNQNASNLRTGANTAYRNAQTTAVRRRQDYTNERSALFPTAGSSPVNAGLKPTTPAKETSPKQTVPKLGVSSKKPAAKFKGRYPGPDKFKGDPKKIAAWKAAKRKVK